MIFFHRNKARALLLASLILSWPVLAKEMPASLREAGRLYEIGRYNQAIDAAKRFNHISPENLESMLIIGMGHFNLHEYAQARDWFRKAAKKSPQNQIARQYIDLIREVEHRFGPFSSDYSLAQGTEDPQKSKEAFKKGWFGHSFPEESQPTNGYFDPIKNLQAPIALEVEAPVEKILVEKTVEKMASEALSGGIFLKAYLFYSQLLQASPENRSYLLGKAESAIKLRRYEEVLRSLGPIMLAPDQKSFSPKELKHAENLLNEARAKLSEL